MQWISVNVTVKKWYVSFDAQFIMSSIMIAVMTWISLNYLFLSLLLDFTNCEKEEFKKLAKQISVAYT